MDNGEIVVLGGKGALKRGLLGLFGQTEATEDKIEVLNPETGWRELTGANIDVDYWYPKLYAASDGTAVTFAYDGVYRIDTAGLGSSIKIGEVTFPNRQDSPSVMYDIDQIAIVRDEAERPQIVDVVSNGGNNETFQTTVDDVSDIAKVTALRTGGFTHAVNFDSRFTELEFEVVDGNTIEVTSLSAGEMIPGAWMLFVIDSNGVPSKASMLGVAMVDLVETPNLTVVDGELGVYGIDDDQIDGAFEIQVEARFDDLSQEWQRVFDFGNGASSDNIVLTQQGQSDDMRFAIYIEGQRYHITAKDVIVEGEVAKWIANVDEGGYMRLYKDDVLVAEGQGAVPRDVARTSNLVGESNWDGDDALNGLVRNLEIVNAGDLPEYIHIGTPKIGLRSLGDVSEADVGETTTLVFEAYLDQPAPAIITADIVLESGDAVAPAKLIIGAGQTSGLIEVTAAGNDDFSLANPVTISLANVTQARVEGALTASATIIDNDGGDIRDLLASVQIVGDAREHGDGVRLTAESKGQEGAIGTTSRIDFTRDFEINASVYLGDNNGGADGMGFVFHNDDDGAGAIGGGGSKLGAYGIKTGFGFELDTHKGDDDIGEDHFTFFNANTEKRLSGHVALDNLEDGDMHDVEITWDASGLKLTVSLDGQELGSLQGPEAYALLGDDYGYLTIAAATGGRTNEYRVDSLTFEGTFEGEVPLVSIAAPADQLEGAASESGELVFVATLSEVAAADVIASLTVTGADGPTSVTIPAGATSAEIVVSYLGNDAYDGDTAVTVQLTGALNANLGESPAATATILDDDTPETRDLIGGMVLNGHAALMGDSIRLTPDSGSKKRCRGHGKPDRLHQRLRD